MSCLPVARLNVRNCFGINQVTTPHGFDLEENLHVSQLRSDEMNGNTTIINKYCDASTSTTRLRVTQSNEASHITLHSTCEGSEVFAPNIELPMSVQINMLKESLEENFNQKMEKIGQSNTMQFSEIAERNKGQCKETEKQVKQNLKEIRETIKLQHRETRRRLERIEKKTNSGYFN